MTYDNLYWSGTLAEYVALLKRKVYQYKRAHERVYSAIQDALKNPTFDTRLIGMDEMIEKIMTNYFLPASRRYDIRKRLLILIGPPGSGKSSFVRFIKRALEAYSYKKEGAIFKIKHCPLNEDPLLALPLEERVTLYNETGIRVDGFLSPLNQLKLMNNYDGNWRNIEVERFFINEAKRSGIGTFFPTDPYNQDISDLIGAVDFSKLTTYGSPSDPRAYRYDGEFQVANQGLLELHELFKSETRLLYPFLTLAEENTYKISRQQMIYTDQVVIGHSNVEDFEQFSQRKNEALLNRMQLVRFPYTLKLNDEVKIYQSKFVNGDEKKFATFSLEAAAAFAILTRLKRTKKPFTLLEKMDIYNGEDELARKELLTENSEEGMNGLDPRLIFDRLSIIASNHETIDGRTVLNNLKQMLTEDMRINAEHIDRYEYVLQLTEKYYYNRWETLIFKVLKRRFQKEIEQLFQSYVEQFNEQTTLVKEINRKVGIDEDNDDHFSHALKQLFNKNMQREMTFEDAPDNLIEALSIFVIKQKLNEIIKRYDLTNWINTDLADELAKSEIKLEKNETKTYEKILKHFLNK